MIDLEKLSKEHEKLFPLADIGSQSLKLEEELTELLYARTGQEQIEELADVLIVCCGLYRWCTMLAKSQADGVYNTLGYIDGTPLVLENEVERKWQINLNRKWEWNGKTYHHVEE